MGAKLAIFDQVVPVAILVIASAAKQSPSNDARAGQLRRSPLKEIASPRSR
jgi:hypothetical protein